jgi:hypothetical protein
MTAKVQVIDEEPDSPACSQQSTKIIQFPEL